MDTHFFPYPPHTLDPPFFRFSFWYTSLVSRFLKAVPWSDDTGRITEETNSAHAESKNTWGTTPQLVDCHAKPLQIFRTNNVFATRRERLCFASGCKRFVPLMERMVIWIQRCPHLSSLKRTMDNPWGKGVLGRQRTVGRENCLVVIKDSFTGRKQHKTTNCVE